MLQVSASIDQSFGTWFSHRHQNTTLFSSAEKRNIQNRYLKFSSKKKLASKTSLRGVRIHIFNVFGKAGSFNGHNCFNTLEPIEKLLTPSFPPLTFRNRHQHRTDLFFNKKQVTNCIQKRKQKTSKNNRAKKKCSINVYNIFFFSASWNTPLLC